MPVGGRLPHLAFIRQMKVAIQSYNNFGQNTAGGVRTKIFNYVDSLKAFPDVECKLFDKWSDKLADFDILHCFTLKEEIYDQVRLAHSLGKKIVISSIVPLEKSNWIKFNIFLGRRFHIRSLYYLNKLTLDMTDAVITETGKETAFICDTYGVDPERVIAIPNGVSTDVQGGDPAIVKERFGFEKECVVHVSRIDRNKNQLSVIRALRDTDIPVIFIGGPDTTDMAYYEQCRAEATPNMFFAGWVRHDDPLFASTLAAAKVSVLPSYKETFGYSIYEGLLAGCNVVATNAIPVSEWGLDKDVISIDPYRVEDIRKAILEAYEKPRNPLVAEKVSSLFSFHSIAQRHVDLYRKILA